MWTRKQIYKLLDIALLLCFCTGCAKERGLSDGEQDKQGNTYMNVMLSLLDNGSESRADDLPTTYGSEADRRVEELLLCHRLYSGSIFRFESRMRFTESDLVYSPDRTMIRRREAWAVNPTGDGQTIDFAIFANLNLTDSELQGYDFGNSNKTIDYSTQPIRYDSVSGQVTAVGFTARLTGNTIRPTVPKNLAETFVANAVNNNFGFDLQRIVARIAVRTNSEEYVVRNPQGYEIGSFFPDSFAVANVSKRAYLFEQSDDPYAMTAYTDVENASKTNYWRMGDADSPLRSVPVNLGQGGDVSHLSSVYCFENLEPSGDAVKDVLAWGQTTYLKIYGRFRPISTRIYKKVAGGTSDIGEGFQTITPEEYTEWLKGEPTDLYCFYVLESNIPRFFMNVEDANSYKDQYRNQIKDEKLYRYIGARCAYKTPVCYLPMDADFNTLSRPVTNIDVRRNHYYVLKIDKFIDMPANVDSMDPNDPHLKGQDGMEVLDKFKFETKINHVRNVVNFRLEVNSWRYSDWNMTMGPAQNN